MSADVQYRKAKNLPSGNCLLLSLFIAYQDANGASRKFKGGTIAKRSLVEAKGLSAAIDDGVLNVPYTVTSFSMMFVDAMGNYIPEVSKNGEFTQKQKDMIRNLSRGKRFYISNIKTLKPSGEPYNIESSMEVVVN
jgi:GldM C-terminal domain.